MITISIKVERERSGSERAQRMDEFYMVIAAEGRRWVARGQLMCELISEATVRETCAC